MTASGSLFNRPFFDALHKGEYLQGSFPNLLLVSSSGAILAFNRALVKSVSIQTTLAVQDDTNVQFHGYHENAFLKYETFMALSAKRVPDPWV